MFRRWRDWHYGVGCLTSILHGLHPVIALRVSNLVGPYPGWLLVSFSSYRNVSGVLIRGLLILHNGDCRPLNEFGLSRRTLKLLLYVHRLTLSGA